MEETTFGMQLKQRDDFKEHCLCCFYLVLSKLSQESWRHNWSAWKWFLNSYFTTILNINLYSTVQKEIIAKFAEFRPLFSRKFAEISQRNFARTPANFRWMTRNFAEIFSKFRVYVSEISVTRKFQESEISLIQFIMQTAESNANTQACIALNHYTVG